MLGFSVLKQITDVWASLGIGVAIGIAFLAAAWFLPLMRQLFIGLACGAFAATWFFGQGVLQERQVCKARQAEAEQLRVERDADQKRIAGEDEQRLQAQIDIARKREQEAQAKYEKAIAKNPRCVLTPDDLR